LSSLALALRAATTDAHRRLERDLDLLAPPLSQQRFTALLMRFWGFHAVWEPTLLKQPGLRGLMADRVRLGLIETDLRALGLGHANIQALPLCAGAADLAASTEQGLGSLYVLEGSTMGGRLISRALAQAAWLPAYGLRYFDPYGRGTGVMWRQFQAVLNAAASPEADRLALTAAVNTFDVLHQWLLEDR